MRERLLELCMFSVAIAIGVFWGIFWWFFFLLALDILFPATASERLVG